MVGGKKGTQDRVLYFKIIHCMRGLQCPTYHFSASHSVFSLVLSPGRPSELPTRVASGLPFCFSVARSGLAESIAIANEKTLPMPRPADEYGECPMPRLAKLGSYHRDERVSREVGILCHWHPRLCESHLLCTTEGNVTEPYFYGLCFCGLCFALPKHSLVICLPVMSD
jgi:hypothetical protein